MERVARRSRDDGAGTEKFSCFATRGRAGSLGDRSDSPVRGRALLPAADDWRLPCSENSTGFVRAIVSMDGLFSKSGVNGGKFSTASESNGFVGGIGVGEDFGATVMARFARLVDTGLYISVCGLWVAVGYSFPWITHQAPGTHDRTYRHRTERRPPCMSPCPTSIVFLHYE